MEHVPHPEESGRHEVTRVLGETLRQLEFEESPIMRDLHGVITDAMQDDDPATALAAYARYQELGQEIAEKANTSRARLALSIACAQLLAERNEPERCYDALQDCILDADGQGLSDVADKLTTLF